MSQCTCTRRDRSHVKEDVTAQAGGGGVGAAVTNHFQDFPHRLLNRALPQLISSQFLHVRLCPLSRFKKKNNDAAQRELDRPAPSLRLHFFHQETGTEEGKPKRKGCEKGRTERGKRGGDWSRSWPIGRGLAMN